MAEASNITFTEVQEGAYCESSGSERILRARRVFDLVGYAENELTTLKIALENDNIPDYGDGHPDDPGAVVTKKRCRPVSYRHARVEVDYDREGLVIFPVNQFRARDTTTMGQNTTRYVPGTGEVITVNTDFDNGRTAEITYPSPIRTRIYEGTFNDPPPITWPGAGGKVNDRPFLGLPKGYWLCNLVDVASPDSLLTFTVTISFITQTIQDWSQFAQVRDGFGKIQALNNFPAGIQEYSHGSYSPADSNWAQVGPHAEEDFATLFGI